MDRSGRRILLAIEPTVLEGALAKMLSVASNDEVVQAGHRGVGVQDGGYDAAVVSDRLPDSVRADVVITLPDTRGSGGTGTVTTGSAVHEVSIAGAERVVELLEQYSPHHH